MPNSYARWLAPACLILLCSFFTLLYLAKLDGYQYFISIPLQDPWDFPFLDTVVVLSWIECHRGGVDVFVANPCDVLDRPVAQSPAWLYFTGTGVDTTWTIPLGIVLDVTFICTACWLLRARTWSEAIILTLALCSPTVLFALERGNTDLIVFQLATLAAFLAIRSWPVRGLGYGAALLAGLLKFYPLVVLVLVVRERLQRALILALIVSLVVSGFVWWEWHNLVRVLAILPSDPWNGYGFGAHKLPVALARMIAGSSIPPVLGWIVPIGFAAGVAALVLLRGSWHRQLEALTPFEAALFLAGAAMMVACFFISANYMYRATLLLLTVPALLSLSRTGDWMAWLGGISIILVTWMPRLRRPGGGSRIGEWSFVAYLSGQIAWWYLMGLFIALILMMILLSPAFAPIRRRVLPARLA